MKSIMHNKADRTCYLCMALHGDYSEQTVLEEHHAIYGHGRRALSTKYGLMVYLCPRHHKDSPESVHGNTIGMSFVGEYIKRMAETVFMKVYPSLHFREIFGKHYLSKWHRETIREQMRKDKEKGERSAAGVPDGFIQLDNEEEDI